MQAESSTEIPRLTATAAAPDTDGSSVATWCYRLAARSPRLRSWVWKTWYEFLAKRHRQAGWAFMNYGYAPLNEAAAKPTLAAGDEPNRCFIQLYQHVLDGIELRGRDVLEVGCGRGGGCSYLARYKHPRRVLGVDISANSVALCRAIHPFPRVSFQQGAAEALPCGDATFDDIVNVESSHGYASMENFLAEVRRVLRPGGHLLWADLRSRGELNETRRQFRNSGLCLQRETTITANVLRALDLLNDRKETAIRLLAPKWFRPVFREFAGIKGTHVYEAFRKSEMLYLSCVLQKPIVAATETG